MLVLRKTKLVFKSSPRPDPGALQLLVCLPFTLGMFLMSVCYVAASALGAG